MNIKGKVLSKVDQVSDVISSSPIVKGLIDGGLSLVPFFGQAITSALDTRAFQLFEANSRQFAEEVHRVVSGLDESKLDKQFIESDEFVSLLAEILAHNARTYEQEKVRLYARVFVNAATYSKSKTPYKEGFVRIIDELSIDHVRALAFVYERSKTLSADNEKSGTNRVLVEEIAEALNVPSSRIQAYCEQMIRFGLLRDWAIGKYGYKPGSFAMTDYGCELAEFLKLQE